MLPHLNDYLLGRNLPDEIVRYPAHFRALVKDFDNIDLQVASNKELARWFLKYGIVKIVMLQPESNYTKQQIYGFKRYATQILEWYADQILDWMYDWARANA